MWNDEKKILKDTPTAKRSNFETEALFCGGAFSASSTQQNHTILLCFLTAYKL